MRPQERHVEIDGVCPSDQPVCLSCGPSGASRPGVISNRFRGRAVGLDVDGLNRIFDETTGLCEAELIAKHLRD